MCSSIVLYRFVKVNLKTVGHQKSISAWQRHRTSQISYPQELKSRHPLPRGLNESVERRGAEAPPCSGQVPGAYPGQEHGTGCLEAPPCSGQVPGACPGQEHGTGCPEAPPCTGQVPEPCPEPCPRQASVQGPSCFPEHFPEGCPEQEHVPGCPGGGAGGAGFGQ
ncbi:hypothetical protein NECAME_12893 [Necator americanus]|uniref:Uncharacterized protein n=1 Tax=Necator americanus TaxID=51031 RepID=W2SYG3_NECAM|nr:hypothetical protein NECAME_12893 [Necator americanus]ETN74583.1 hypothetical protein NECAME_12893 [Necator americanus]